MNILLEGIVGSTAQGLAREGSDVDRLGVFAAPTLEIAGLDWNAKKESKVTTNPDVAWYEAGKMARLLIKGNPSVVELLFLEDYLYSNSHGDALVTNREYFLEPELVKNAYAGFARSQLDKKSFFKGNKKSARHALRLARQGKELITTGTLTVKVPDPQIYFDLDDMDQNDVINLLIDEIWDLRELKPPYALTKFDRSKVQEWLSDVRREYL